MIELWADTKDICDNYVYNGGHYVAVMEATEGSVVIYNRRVIEEYGLEDPAELLENDEWNWNTFKDMMVEFCDAKEGNYGLDSWWYESAIMQTGGAPAVKMQDGLIVSNLMDPNLEAVQEFMLSLQKDNLPLPRAEFGWTVLPERINTGETLFYIGGTWLIGDLTTETFGTPDEVMFVPMPKNPNTEEYYLPAGMNAVSFVKDGPNPGVLQHTSTA